MLMLPRMTMAPKISASCWAEYQKIRRAELIVSLVTLNGCEENFGSTANVFNARLRNTTH